MFEVRPLILAVLILSINLPLMPRNEYRYLVLAQAVDDSGQAVPFAHVVIAPGANNSGGDFTYSGNADASGRIRFEITDSDLVKRTRLMYITGPFPKNAITPVTPPFDEFPLPKRSIYGGKRILIEKNGKVDLGNVQVKTFYGLIKVFLKDRLGKPLVRDVKAWNHVVVSIYDGQGHFMAETSISKKQIEEAVDPSRSSLAVGLPQGTWRIGISLNESNKPSLMSPPIIVKGSSTKDLNLKMR